MSFTFSITWVRLMRLFDFILHLWPGQRFSVNYPR
jgi:hypothetical protein